MILSNHPGELEKALESLAHPSLQVLMDREMTKKDLVKDPKRQEPLTSNASLILLRYKSGGK
jgi:hypothetical protein